MPLQKLSLNHLNLLKKECTKIEMHLGKDSFFQTLVERLFLKEDLLSFLETNQENQEINLSFQAVKKCYEDLSFFLILAATGDKRSRIEMSLTQNHNHKVIHQRLQDNEQFFTNSIRARWIWALIRDERQEVRDLALLFSQDLHPKESTLSSVDPEKNIEALIKKEFEMADEIDALKDFQFQKFDKDQQIEILKKELEKNLSILALQKSALLELRKRELQARKGSIQNLSENNQPIINLPKKKAGKKNTQVKELVFIDVANLSNALERKLGKRVFVDFEKIKIELNLSEQAKIHAYVIEQKNNPDFGKFKKGLIQMGISVISKIPKEQSNGEFKANLDIEIASDILKWHFQNSEQKKKFFLVSGDGDFEYLVKTLLKAQSDIQVAFLEKEMALELKNLGEPIFFSESISF